MMDLVAVFIGIVIGILCGLIPGLHPNSTIPIILSLSLLFDPLVAVIILITAGVANTFISFIPAVLLGAPESDEALSSLPGHRLLLRGRGYEAIKLTVIGGIFSVFVVFLTLPFFFFIIPKLYVLIRPHIHFLLIFIVLYMLFSEKSKSYALFVFLLSGFLGLMVLNNFSNNFLFPLLSGLFGLPLLFLSIKRNVKLPEYITFETEKLEIKKILPYSFVGMFSGLFAGLIPGLGTTQSTVIAQELTGKKNDKGFLIAIGGVNTVDIIYSLFAIYLIGNPRSGIAVAVNNLIDVGLGEIFLFVSLILISAGFSGYITLKISKKFIFFIRRIDYRKLCLYVFCFVLLLIFIFTGFYGLFIAFISLSIGLIPNIIGIRRSHCMGCLILPTILYFSGIM